MAGIVVEAWWYEKEPQPFATLKIYVIINRPLCYMDGPGSATPGYFYIPIYQVNKNRLIITTSKPRLLD